jgi:hypothetical protein
MKSPWTEASPIIRRNIETTFALGVPFVFPNGSDWPSAATTWTACAEIAWGAGFDIEAPETPHSARHAELSAAGEYAIAIRYHATHGVEIKAEQRATLRWVGMRRWAEGPSKAELDEQARAKREAEALTVKVEARALVLVAEHDTVQRTKALTQARTQAAKELRRVDD